MEIISFQKSLELANSKAKPLVKKPKLLLGNGFSLAFDKKIFNSNSYYDTAVKKGFFSENQRLYKLLKDIGVSDF